MAYDEALADRIRELIASEDGYTEQKMFGGIGFMIDGHMALGVSGEPVDPLLQGGDRGSPRQARCATV
jgi:TfoX/Sxy family transcriptional regulator of competence genes